MDGGDQVAAAGEPATSCALDRAGVYSPYRDDDHIYPSGPVALLPWRGAASSYPDGAEDFRGYQPLPATVECASAKQRRGHLDVTAGCLQAVALGEGGRYQRGLVRTTADGSFRALALGHDEGDPLPVKWTDQAVEYRFFHRGQSGTGSNPGFKAFVRYRSEDDLYVASWRFDGVVQIQRKRCGEYLALAMRRDLPPPSPAAWHHIRFEAIGEQLVLALDGEEVLAVGSPTFSWGTAGIRIDAADGAYIDDWRVSDPAE